MAIFQDTSKQARFKVQDSPVDAGLGTKREPNQHQSMPHKNHLVQLMGLHITGKRVFSET
jgi:hypothetical protein